MYAIMENDYEMERFMDAIFLYNTILWDESWILDWLVSDHVIVILMNFVYWTMTPKKRK